MLGQTMTSFAAAAALVASSVSGHVARGRWVIDTDNLHGLKTCSEYDAEPWPVLAGPHMECGTGTSPFQEVKCGRLECQHVAEAAEADMYAYMDGLCRVCYDKNLAQTKEPSFVFRRPTAEGPPQSLLTKYGIQPSDADRYDARSRWNWVRQHHSIVNNIHSQVAGNMSAKQLPSLKKLQKRLKNITAAAMKNPCQADILAMSPEHQVGFGSRINSLAEELMVALYGNYSFAICQQVNTMTFVRDAYLKFFNTSFGDVVVPVCTSAETCQPIGGEESTLGIAQAGRQLSASLHEAKRDYLLQLKRLIYPHVFNLRNNATEMLNQTLAQIGITNVTRYIGVHIRRGDKIKEATPVATEVYAASAVAAAKGLGVSLKGEGQKEKVITKVYLATDDLTEVGKFTRAINGEMEVIRQPPQTQAVLSSRDYTSMESTFSVLTDIEALRRSEVFIGTASSNIGTLVSLMRGNMPSISLDMGGDWMSGAN